MLMHINFSSTSRPGFVAISPKELNERVRTVQNNLAHTPAAREEAFGAKLKGAVKARLSTRAGRSRSHTVAEQDESLGTKISRAVKARLGARPGTLTLNKKGVKSFP